MRVRVPTFILTACAVAAGCVVSEAFLPSTVFSGQAQTSTAIASSRRSAPAQKPDLLKALLRPSTPASAAESRSKFSAGSIPPSLPRRPNARGYTRQASVVAVAATRPGRGEGLEDRHQGGRANQNEASRSSDAGDDGNDTGLSRFPVAAAAAWQQLRRAAATTTLAAVLLLASASTEQDIMTAMMGIDPSFGPANTAEAQTALTTPKEGAKGGTAKSSPSLGSIDLTGQSDGSGEIPGGAGGGFKNGRLLVDVDSDLAVTLGKKMKTPDAEPRTH